MKDFKTVMPLKADARNATGTIGADLDGHSIILGGGFTVSQRFFENVLKHVRAEIQKLTRGDCYTSEVLCGTALWASLGKSEHKLAGKCIAYAVAQDLLPLEFAGRTDANARLYRLK